MRYLLLLLVAFSLTAQIPGTFRVTGPVAPPATNSNLGASLPVYNYGGLLTGLTSLTQLQDLNRYPLARRQAGMVARLTSGAEYILGSDLTSWYNSGSVSNIAQLLLVEPGADGGIVNVDGYYSSGAGGAARYVLTNSVSDTNAYGGKLVASGGAKSWQILPENGKVTSNQWGLFSGTSNLLSMQMWLNYTSTNNLIAHLDPGDYGCTNSLILASNTYLEGLPTSRFLTMGVDSQTNSQVYGTIRSITAFQPYVTNGGFVGRIVPTSTNITLKGFTVATAPGWRSRFSIVLMGVQDVRIDSVNTDISTNHWAYSIFGNNILASNLRIRNTGSVYQDGFHIIGGDKIALVNSDIETGDDCIALTSGYSIETDISNVTVANCVVKSTHGHALRFATENANGTNYVRDVVVTGITGTAGLVRNALVRSESLSTVLDYPIKNISITGVRLSGIGKGAWVAGDYGFAIWNADNVILTDCHASETTLWNYYIHNSGTVTLKDCTGTGATATAGLNATLFADNTIRLNIIGGSYKTTGLLSTDVMFVRSLGTFNVTGAYIENSITNRNCIATDSPSVTNLVILGCTITNSLGSGIATYVTPETAIVIGNNFSVAGTAFAWPGVTPPTVSVVENNIGYSIADPVFLSREAFNVLTSGGSYIGTFGQVGSSFLRLNSTNQLTVLSQDANTGGTKSPGLAFQSSPNNTPNAGLKVTDNGTSIVAALAGGTSLAKAAMQFDLYASDYYGVTTGTKMLTVTTNGFRIGKGVPAGTDAATILRVDSTTQGVLFTPMTKAQRDAITGMNDGQHIYQTDAGNYGPRWYSTTLGGWMTAAGVADP